MKPFAWVLIVVLLLLHHDFWFWNDDRLIFGFIPIGMAYHIGVSLVAAFSWFLIVSLAWPDDLDDVEPESDLEFGEES